MGSACPWGGGAFPKWTDLMKDGDKSTNWYRKMKSKERNARMGDAEIMCVSEEVKGTRVEKRSRAEFYGYGTIVHEHPD